MRPGDRSPGRSWGRGQVGFGSLDTQPRGISPKGLSTTFQGEGRLQGPDPGLISPWRCHLFTKLTHLSSQ